MKRVGCLLAKISDCAVFRSNKWSFAISSLLVEVYDVAQILLKWVGDLLEIVTELFLRLSLLRTDVSSNLQSGVQ